MGLITRLKAVVGREEDPAYVCEECGAGFQEEHQLCTECGSTAIVPAE